LIRGGIRVIDAEMISASPTRSFHSAAYPRPGARQPLLLARRRLVAGANPTTGRLWQFLLSLVLGEIGGRIAECGTPRSLWLPHVKVAEVTNQARRLGAGVILEPLELGSPLQRLVHSRARKRLREAVLAVSLDGPPSAPIDRAPTPAST
jgi:hypothetical protein